MLIGDVNGNGIVNASDVAQVKAQIGTAGLTSCRADVVVNGAINSTDLGQVKASTGNTVP